MQRTQVRDLRNSVAALIPDGALPMLAGLVRAHIRPSVCMALCDLLRRHATIYDVFHLAQTGAGPTVTMHLAALLDEMI